MSAGTGPRRIVVLGATSTIAEATARRYAASRASILLAGRGADRLDAVKADLEVRGASWVLSWPVDLAATPDAAAELTRMTEAIGGVDAIFLFYGVLGDQRRAESDMVGLEEMLRVNFSSAAAWCVAAAGILEQQKHGVLVVTSSVAGDRGRQSNYLYGAAKAGITVLVEGIAHRLAPSGARAVAVKLGFVDTKMTAHMPKSGPLWAKPEAVARHMQRIADDRASPPVVYLPWFWRPIMTVVRAIPVSIFHRTKL